MKVVLKAEVQFDDGQPAWGYYHEEIVVGELADVDPREVVTALREGRPMAPETEEAVRAADYKSAGAALDRTLDLIDEMRDRLLAQAASELRDPGASDSRS